MHFVKLILIIHFFQIPSHSQLMSPSECGQCLPGPQVPPLGPHSRLTSGPQRCSSVVEDNPPYQSCVYSRYLPGERSDSVPVSHIYMEVDPVYTLHHSETHSEIMSSETSDEDLAGTQTEMVSGNSSQTSSGYSTAPSQPGERGQLTRGTASVLRAVYGQENLRSQDTVFSISHNVDRHTGRRDRERSRNKERSLEHPLIRLT